MSTGMILGSRAHCCYAELTPRRGSTTRDNWVISSYSSGWDLSRHVMPSSGLRCTRRGLQRSLTEMRNSSWTRSPRLQRAILLRAWPDSDVSDRAPRLGVEPVPLLSHRD